MALQNHAWENILLRMQDRLMDLNVAEYEEFIAVVSESALHLTFKKLLLVKSRCSIKQKILRLSENAIKIILPFQLHICLKQDFLNILQST